MPFSDDDDQLDLETFLRNALKEKISRIEIRIETLTGEGAPHSEIDRWTEARDRFAAASERIPLLSAQVARAAPAAARTSPINAGPDAPPLPGPGDARADSPSASRLLRTYKWVPAAAIPQPRPYGQPKVAASGTSSGAAAAPRETPAAHTTLGAGGAGGMLGFLKGFQNASAADSAPPLTQHPVETSGPATASTGMLSFLQNISAAPKTPAAAKASPEPVPAAPPSSPGGGAMLSFLKKMQSGDPAPQTEPDPEPRDAEAAKDDVLESLKRRAATSGFRDVYEMLRFKRERLAEARKELESRPDPSSQRLLELLEKEIAEIDQMMDQDQRKIAANLSEFNEVASVDKGGVRELQKELSGLFDELK